MIKFILPRILNVTSQPHDKILALTDLINAARSTNNLWGVIEISRIEDFVWRSTNVQLSLGLVVALGEYAIRTKDTVAVDYLNTIHTRTHHYDIEQTTEYYLSQLGN